MGFTVAVCGISCLLLIISVCTKPSVQIGKHTVSIYWVAPLLGAIILLLSGHLGITELFAGLLADSAMNPIKILVLFLCMTMLSIYLDATGFFSLLATTVLRRAQFSQKRLFVYLYLIVSVLTVFTSNDVVVLTFTPFICYFAVNANIRPMPYLLCAFVAANTWSMALLIGNPTNMYLAADIDFIAYLQVMWLPTLLAGVASFAALFLLFRKQLSRPIEQGYPHYTVQNPTLMIIGLIHLSVCIVLLVISAYIALPMWGIAAGTFVSLVLCTLIYCIFRKEKPYILKATVQRAPLETVPFILSMFSLVLALQQYGVTDLFANVLQQGNPVVTYGVTSFGVANVINNIPMSVLYAAIIGDGVANLPALYATVIGSNIGAYCTPLGALAGIMFKGLLRDHGIVLSFKQFIRYGLAVALPTLLAALLGLWLVL